MTALLDHFHEVITTVGDVEKLKKIILHLAMQGKLVEQDPNDEPASVLVKRIEREKEQLFKEKKIKKQKPLTSIADEEKPYLLPKGWEWVRLGTISNYGTSEKIEYKSVDNNCWLLELEDIEKSSSRLIKKIRVKDRSFSSSKNVFYFNDVLYGKLRPYLDKIIVADEDGICSTEIMPIRLFGNVNPKFVMYTLKRPDFLEYIDSKMYGMKMPRLGTEDGRSSLIPLPPLQEQERIVSKIEELIYNCDQLLNNIVKKQTHSELLNKSVFVKLQDHNNPSQMDGLCFVMNNIEHLCNDKASIDQFRNSLLSLAVQGKLVEQDPYDEPASVLLEKIKEEKDRLIKEKKNKKEKQLPPIKEEEVPYDLPKGWEWVRFNDISYIASNLVDPAKFNDFPLIAPDCIEKGTGRLINYSLVKDANVISSKHLFREGQIIYSKIRPNLSKLIIADFNGLCSADMYPIDSFICTKYLFYYMLSPVFLEMAVKTDTRVAMPKINQQELNKIIVPLPPYKEQEKIVKKIDNVIKISNKLAKKISEKEEKRISLLNSTFI
jgi:type I restriction enzyme, S subunit